MTHASDVDILIAAIQANDLGQVRVLIANGSDLNDKDEWGRPVLYAAIAPEVDTAILRQLLDSGASVSQADWSGESLICAAARFSSPEIIEMLIAAGADPNGALSGTAMNDLVDNARVLLAAGADIDHADEEFGRTALHAAFEIGAHALVDLLLESGADPHVTDKRGDNVLHIMAQVYCADLQPLVDRALAAGVDPRVVNDAGDRAADLLGRAGVELDR